MNEKLFDELVELRNILFLAETKIPESIKDSNPEIKRDIESLTQKITTEMENIRDSEND